MTTVRIKGYDINVPPIRDSFDRRALKFKNNIIATLGKLGLTEDDVEIELERVAMKRAAASASWWMEDERLYFSYERGGKYVENLFIVWKVIECEVNALLNEEKTMEEFVRDFTEDDDVEEKRKEARKTLDLAHDEKDMQKITQRYRELAKKHHPDMPDGSLEHFKKVNNAHKILKRELE